MILCSYITDNKIPELPVELARCQRLEVLHAGVNLIKEVDPQLFRGPAPPPTDDDVQGVEEENGMGSGAEKGSASAGGDNDQKDGFKVEVIRPSGAKNNNKPVPGSSGKKYRK